MSPEVTVRFVLGELYNKVCNCRRDYEEMEDKLNPVFHLEDCPYRVLVEKEKIEWTEES